MNIIIKGKQNNIAVVDSEEILISDSTSALDMAMSIQYEANTSDMVIPKQCIIEDFFQLSTKLAGEILQKYMNYGIRIAIVGDFSEYKSKALRILSMKAIKESISFLFPQSKMPLKN